jgi:hypothetical protein
VETVGGLGSPLALKNGEELGIESLPNAPNPAAGLNPELELAKVVMGMELLLLNDEGTGGAVIIRK